MFLSFDLCLPNAQVGWAAPPKSHDQEKFEFQETSHPPPPVHAPAKPSPPSKDVRGEKNKKKEKIKYAVIFFIV